MSLGPLPPLRLQPTDRLPGTTSFARDDALRGGLNVVKLLKSQRWVWNDLRAACDLEKNWGRHRELGHWELAAVAFVVSGHVDVQPWHDSTTDELWQECGFAVKPPYKRVWRRLRELEDHVDAFVNATGTLVQHARKHDSRVGAHVHFDGTEDETHAALVHDCERGQCPRAGRGSRAGRGRSGAGQRPERESTAAVRKDRQRQADLPPDDVAREMVALSPDRAVTVEVGGRTVKRVQVGGCWYRTLDAEAGIRAYTSSRGARRFWHGYYNQKATCHFTGGVLYAGVYSASRQEYYLFDDVYDKTCQVVGAAPDTAVADKGYSIASVFKKCTTNGTAPVMPWRASGYEPTRQDKDTHDRHGVPRCKHCGATTSFVRFHEGDRSKPAGQRKPRLWARCMVGATGKCAKDQTFTCSTDWRLLVPLWRTDPLYHELKESHSSYEGVHDYWRDRYKVAADNLANRPKVRSIGWHRLRANVAGLVEWLRICTREGWLGSARRNHKSPTRAFKDAGQRAATKLATFRMSAGVAQPYGPKAASLNLGDVDPPSRRTRGAP